MLYRHGKTKTRLHNIWLAMRNRCNSKKGKHYKYYKQKGIVVCKDWDDFFKFYKWAHNNGYDDSLTIDRINSNKGYMPTNCRWVSYSEQNRNTSRNILIEIDGEIKCGMDWSNESGVPHQTIYDRHKRGVRGKDLLAKKLITNQEFYIRNKKLKSGKKYYEVHIPVGNFQHKKDAIAQRNKMLDILAENGFFCHSYEHSENRG